MEIEDIARVSLAPRWTTEQQGDLAIRLCVLRKVVIDAERVAARVAEILAHRARRIGAYVKERRRIGSSGGDDDRVAHRVGVLERLHDLRDRRLLLTDRVVDTDNACFFL